MLNNLDLSQFFSRAVILVIAFTVHEFAHAWSAVRFGDDTPRLMGRLTLNPLVHLDVMGSFMLLFAGFGWAKPVPINPYAIDRRSSLGTMWVSLAGPFSNFMLAVLAAVPLRLGVPDFGFAGNAFLPSPSQFLWEFVIVNLSLMLFNLLPIAPLDGEKIALYIFPPAWSQALQRFQPYGPVVLLALFFAAPLLGINPIAWVIQPVLINLLRVMGLV